jgi:hypothetical protein
MKDSREMPFRKAGTRKGDRLLFGELQRMPAPPEG